MYVRIQSVAQEAQTGYNRPIVRIECASLSVMIVSFVNILWGNSAHCFTIFNVLRATQIVIHISYYLEGMLMSVAARPKS